MFRKILVSILLTGDFSFTKKDKKISSTIIKMHRELHKKDDDPFRQNN
jgi:hypothetical protein